MKPTTFEEQNKIFTAPAGMDNCEPLPTFANGEIILSCWEMSMEERLAALLQGKIWLGVVGQGHPPVWLSAHYPFQTNENFGKTAEKSELDALIKQKIEEFDTYCFGEGFDVELYGEYTKEQYLTEFLNFLFELKQPLPQEDIEFPEQID